MQTTFSLHKIHSEDTLSFDPSKYSEFKFGNETFAKEFGISLATGFIEHQFKRHPIRNQIVVVSSPYSFIPTATFTLKNYFVYTLNRWLADNNYDVIQEAKVHRTITYKEDYGELNAEQRMRLIGNDFFHIDREFLLGKTLIFLDDIRITGSHERMINKMLVGYNLDNDNHLLYFAELVNDSIHPSFENHLNYYAVKSIFDLDKIINSDFFSINTRIVKYILNYDFNAFKIFIENQTEDFVALLYNMALGNNYHSIKEYSMNLSFIKNDLLFKNNKQKSHGN